jgi:putative MATE family efflux protein
MDLGIAGSAWGTVIAQLVSGFWFLTILARRMAEHGTRFAPDPEQLRRLLRVGRQIAVRTASLLGALALATSVAARFGPATLGGHQIAMQVWFLLALSMDALAVAAQAMVGTALGRGHPAEAREAARRAVQLGLVVSVVLAVVVGATAGVLPRLFSTDVDVLDRARLGLLMVAVTQAPASMAFVLDGVLEGAADFRFLQWALLGALVVFVPFAVGARLAHLGIVGLWAALTVWLCVRAAALAVRFRGTRWLESVHG